MNYPISSRSSEFVRPRTRQPDPLHSRLRPRVWGTVGGLICMACLLGCSKEDLNELANKAKEVATETTQTVQDKVEKTVAETGSISIATSPAFDLDSANIELINVGDGRPSLVQVSSYKTRSGPGVAPSLFLHGNTTATSVSALSGQTVACQLFLRASESGVISKTPDGSSVSVTFQSVDTESNTISMTLGQASLQPADGSAAKSFGSGTIKAVIRGGNGS